MEEKVKEVERYGERISVLKRRTIQILCSVVRHCI